MTYVLDACALIALLNEEEGKEKIDGLFTQAKAGKITLCISIINMLEVYYGFIGADGLERANEILFFCSGTMIANQSPVSPGLGIPALFPGVVPVPQERAPTLVGSAFFVPLGRF
ncbi:PIN domain-containing protein [Treponema primitia]|uniref:PIN domain-containing protein n=1 Tax=Treponema primitia TaxID=88058 RepID=UPI00025551AE|nr:PIN domain-containing protein [Treponema primitia]